MIYESGPSATGAVTFTELAGIFAHAFESGNMALWTTTCTFGSCGAEATSAFGRPGGRGRIGGTAL